MIGEAMVPAMAATVAPAAPVPIDEPPAANQLPPEARAALALPMLNADGAAVLVEYLRSFGMNKTAIAARLGFSLGALGDNLKRCGPVTTRMDRELRAFIAEVKKGGHA
jgi:hypothetical protein